MVISLPLDISFTLSRHELAKGVSMYLLIHSLIWLYLNINKVIRLLVHVERKKIEKQVRTGIIKKHVYEEHPYRLQECLVNDCAMLTSTDL
jgi:hypothetical protein